MIRIGHGMDVHLSLIHISLRSGDPSTQPGFVAIAPALLLVCAMSALRGFMQGQQNMVPTCLLYTSRCV